MLTSWTVLACWDSCFCSTFLDPSYLGLSLYRHEPDQLAGLQYLCSTSLWIWSFKSRLWMLKNLSKNNMGSTIWSKSYCMMVARWGHLRLLVAKKYQRWVHLSVQVHLYPWNFCTEKVQQLQLVASSSTGAIKASWEIDFIWSQLLTTFSLADIHCCTDSFYPVIETSLHTFTSSHGHHDHDKDLEFNFE